MRGEVEEKKRRGTRRTVEYGRGNEAFSAFPFLKTLQESLCLHKKTQAPEPRLQPCVVGWGHLLSQSGHMASHKGHPRAVSSSWPLGRLLRVRPFGSSLSYDSIRHLQISPPLGRLS